MYFIASGAAGLLFIAAMLDATASHKLWIWFGASLVFALVSLNFSADLSTASKHLPKRLGLP
jgi:hypothetical protein